jgi:hypothetical protein
MEAANTIGLVECYHKSLWQAYEIIDNKFKDNSNGSQDTPQDTSQDNLYVNVDESIQS